MTNLEEELQHLLNLMKEPYREYWQPYCEAKARGLAKKYPEDYLTLPDLLSEALKSSASVASFTPGGRSSTGES